MNIKTNKHLRVVKMCSTCKVEQPLADFHKNNRRRDGHESYCKPCRRDRNALNVAKNPEQYKKTKKLWKDAHKEACIRRDKLWRDTNKSALIRRDKIKYRKNINTANIIRGWVLLNYGGTPCVDCQRTFPWCAMDFDHRLGETKSFNIASKGTQKATQDRIDLVEKEILKCDIVCANCHRVRTQQRKMGDNDV